MIKRKERGQGHRRRDSGEAGMDAVESQDARGIGTDPEERRMAETHHAAISHDQIEAEGDDAEDQYLLSRSG